MKRRIANVLKPLLFLGIGLLLVWWSLSGFDTSDKEQILSSIKEANYWWIVASMTFAMMSHISRAMRWQMLMACVAPKPRLINSLLAVSVSYLANLAFPRMGEITRCGIISRYEPVPPEKAFGTVITERIIDVLSLLLLTFAVVITQYKVIGAYFSEKVGVPLMVKFSGFVNSANGLTYLFYLLAAGMVAAVLWWLLRSFRQTVVYQKIISLGKGVAEGVLSVKKVENLPLLIVHSVFIWFMYFAMVYICFFATTGTANLGPQAGLAVMVMGSFGIVATQGGIGAYQIIVAGVLVLYGVEYSLGYAFSWLVWGSQTLLVIIGGFMAMVALPLVNKNRQVIVQE